MWRRSVKHSTVHSGFPFETRNLHIFSISSVGIKEMISGICHNVIHPSSLWRRNLIARIEFIALNHRPGPSPIWVALALLLVSNVQLNSVWDSYRRKEGRKEERRTALCHGSLAWPLNCDTGMQKRCAKEVAVSSQYYKQSVGLCSTWLDSTQCTGKLGKERFDGRGTLLLAVGL
jgi:hypothetical protein